MLSAMFCQMCGTQNPEHSLFCLACGARIGAVAPAAPPPQQGQQWQQPHPPAPPPYGAPPAVVTAPPVAGAAYAGFWLRFVAYLIDGVILSIPMVLLMIPFFGWIFWIAQEIGPGGEPTPEQMLPLFLMIAAVSILIAVGTWVYFAWMESSPRQATFGKSVLGLVVTDMDGRRISFGRATGRHFGKILSSFLYIGFIMVGITERKQGLHDILASTLVLRRGSGGR